MLKGIITRKFNETIRTIFLEKRNIRDWLLKHERKNLCIDNLFVEIRKMDLSEVKILTLDKIENLTADIAKMFINTSLECKRQEMMSLGGKVLFEKKIQEEKEVESPIIAEE